MNPEKHQCSAKIDFDTWGHTTPCKRSATIERDGKWYCKIHDPEYRKQRATERTKVWEKKFNADVAGNIAETACLKINPDNPRAVAEQIVPMYKALKELIDTYWANQGQDGKTCPHPAEFIACITPTGIPDYWRKAAKTLQKAEAKDVKS